MSRILAPPTADMPLLAWLLVALAPTNRTRVKQLLQNGRVVVNGNPTTRFDHPLKTGDRVEIAREGTTPKHPTVPIVFQDDALVVIDKPPGLLTVATDAEKLDTAFVRLGEQLKARVFVAHRLDRETSGLLLFARTEAVRDRLQQNWESLEKTYLAVVEGAPRPPEGAIENYLTDNALASSVGPTYKSLGEFGKPGDSGPFWRKSENWRVAQAMTRAELDNTDLGKFLSEI